MEAIPPKSHSRYLFLVASICALITVVVLAATTCDFYYKHSTAFWDAVEDHQFNVHDQSADVVFVGDSSLVYGVLPDAIKQKTGLSAYSLGIPMPALALVREQLIERYLTHNRKPRLMVLYLSATLRSRPPYANAGLIWYPGETMLMRYGKSQDIVDFFADNPQEISRFPAFVFRRVLALGWTDRRYVELAKTLDDGAGYMPLASSSVLGSQNCPMSDATIVPDTQFIEDFRRIAAARGISTAVYLAPIPDCDPTFKATALNYSRLVDNVPYTLPHQLFADDPERAHLHVAGAEANSPVVSAFVNRFLAAHSAVANAR